MMSNIHIYTDGACSGNPGPGGWGVLIQRANAEEELCGGAAETTNNRMEMMAAIKALEQLPAGEAVTLHTDSTYVMKGITEWIKGWKARDWKNSQKKPVKNKDLWLVLDELVSTRQVTWKWVKGHAGNKGNERADALANQGMEAVR
ncbi:ribonuclease HI [Parvularcula sp. IMCC14364]|uniref:ribonuclease HI n=1 Tax=Parvularcula sp. IMCC14364 TaxID=3067902 RepID=UPI00355846A1